MNVVEQRWQTLNLIHYDERFCGNGLNFVIENLGICQIFLILSFHEKVEENSLRKKRLEERTLSSPSRAKEEK